MSQNALLSLQFTLASMLILLMESITYITLLIINPLLGALTTLKVTSLLSIFMSIKFVILIALLIVVRGGIPRYRYDFLTKLGWIKTLSLVLAVFIVNLLLSYL